MGRGIKKISENVIAEKRSLTLVTYKNKEYDVSNADSDVLGLENFKDNSAGSGYVELVDTEAMPLGMLNAVHGDKGLYMKINDNEWSRLDARNTLLRETVTEKLIGTAAVTTDKIMYRTITTDKIALDAITNREISSESQKIDENGSPYDPRIATENLQDSVVTTPKINNYAVTNEKIGYEAVTTDKLMSSDNGTPAVATKNIQNYAVTNEKLGNKAVTYDKIADNTITTNQIANTPPVNANEADRRIATANLQDDVITTPKIKDHAVTGAKIAPSSIATGHIQDGAITTSKLADGAVTTNKLANGAVTNEKIAQGAISKDKLDAAVFDTVERAVLHDGNMNVTGELGSSALNNITVRGDIRANRVYNVIYMDIAEGYIPGEELEAGDIVAMHEDGKVYKATTINDCIVGVVSEEFANCLGASKEELFSYEKIAVGMIGKIHVKVKGPVRLGQRISISASEPGVGVANWMNNNNIGQALETINCDFDEIHTVLVQVRPM